MRLIAVRALLPAVIATAGVVLVIAGGDTAKAAGTLLLGVAVVVVIANLFMRLGLQSEHDRECEDDERPVFSRTGRWRGGRRPQ